MHYKSAGHCGGPIALSENCHKRRCAKEYRRRETRALTTLTRRDIVKNVYENYLRKNDV